MKEEKVQGRYSHKGPCLICQLDKWRENIPVGVAGVKTQRNETVQCLLREKVQLG